MNEIAAAFGFLGTVCAIVFGYAAFARNGKKDTESEAKQDATVLTEIGYIKANTDDIKRKQDKQDEQYLKMAERMTAVEASAKQAHKRIDRLEGITDRADHLEP